MKKFLIIRFSSIGDIVLTTPVVRCLRKKYPNAQIHFLTKVAFAPIVQANPNIDKVFAIEKSTKSVVEKLKKEGYNHIIDLHKNLRSKKVIIALGVKSTSFPKLNVEKFLMVKFKMNRLPKIHIVDRYFEAVKSLGVNNDKEGLDFFIPEKEQIASKNLPPQFNALVIGAAHKTKSLTTPQLIKIAKESVLPVLLIGGKKEQDIATEIVKKIGDNVINTCGEYNLYQSASVIQQASCVITPDTGMMHIASAFNKKIISVWGNTIPAFGMYPYMPQQINSFKIFEVKELSCRPCSKIGYDECPKRHLKCINDIDVEGIVREMNS
ncbi:MAG: glycosyltransferase family 9 protein [Flavobacteriales bacterium]